MLHEKMRRKKKKRGEKTKEKRRGQKWLSSRVIFLTFFLAGTAVD